MRDSFSVAEIPISSTCIDESGHDRERSMVKIGIVPTITIRFGFKLGYKFPRTDESVLVIYFLAGYLQHRCEFPRVYDYTRVPCSTFVVRNCLPVYNARLQGENG